MLKNAPSTYTYGGYVNNFRLAIATVIFKPCAASDTDSRRAKVKFTASFTDGEVSKGNIAVISQSGAVCTATLDWASKQGKGIGFSVVISSGMSLDIDFGEILDYLIADPYTHSILLYVEGIRDETLRES